MVTVLPLSVFLIWHSSLSLDAIMKLSFCRIHCTVYDLSSARKALNVPAFLVSQIKIRLYAWFLF